MLEIILNPKRSIKKMPGDHSRHFSPCKMNDSRNDSEKIFDFAHDAKLEEVVLAREGR